MKACVFLGKEAEAMPFQALGKEGVGAISSKSPRFFDWGWYLEPKIWVLDVVTWLF